MAAIINVACTCTSCLSSCVELMMRTHWEPFICSGCASNCIVPFLVSIKDCSINRYILCHVPPGPVPPHHVAPFSQLVYAPQ